MSIDKSLCSLSFCRVSKKGDDFMSNIPDYSTLVLYIGVMAFIVSVITEVLKMWKWFDDRVPTPLVVIVLSLVLTPASLVALMSYYGRTVEWYEVFASFVAAFIVALVSMSGWERVTELFERMIKKG